MFAHLYTTEQAARELQVTTGRVRQMVMRGEIIPAHRYPKQTFYTKAEVARVRRKLAEHPRSNLHKAL